MEWGGIDGQETGSFAYSAYYSELVEHSAKPIRGQRHEK
jgi:hypothetical protein